MPLISLSQKKKMTLLTRLQVAKKANVPALPRPLNMESVTSDKIRTKPHRTKVAIDRASSQATCPM